jgi:hypothetical protein
MMPAKGYYHEVFNREVNLDMSKVDKLHQRNMNEHLGRTPSQSEVPQPLKVCQAKNPLGCLE